jgi:hypothetical protein
VNWDAIGAIGEIVGALAVVVSLVYLAIQIRNQNLESKAATVQQVLEGNASAISRLQDPDLAQIWIAGIEDFESLSDVERLRFVIYLTAAFRSLENAYFQWRNGRLDGDTWLTLIAVVKDVKSTTAFTKFFEMRRHHFRSEFVDYLDQLEAGDYSYIRADKKDGA